MKIALSLLVLVAVVCGVRSDLDTEWNNYKIEFNKNYVSKEESFRKELFRLNMEQIKEHNRLYEAGQTTYLMGLNNFSDLTFDEVRKMFMRNQSVERKEAEFSSQWEEYKMKFNKHYESDEETFRKDIFRKNMEKINEHNKKFQSGESTYEMGVNNFSDMTFEEYKKYL